MLHNGEVHNTAVQFSFEIAHKEDSVPDDGIKGHNSACGDGYLEAPCSHDDLERTRLMKNDAHECNESTIDAVRIGEASADVARADATPVNANALDDPVDVISVDAVHIDATTVDATTVDATTVDATTVDASTEDATTVDATTVDVTTVDATTVDATTVDATTVNATTVDATTVDATFASPTGKSTNQNLQPGKVHNKRMSACILQTSKNFSSTFAMPADLLQAPSIPAADLLQARSIPAADLLHPAADLLQARLENVSALDCFLTG